MSERTNSHMSYTTLLSNLAFSQYVQPFVIPIVFTLCSFVGIAVTSAGIQLYGEVLWDPLLLIDHWDNRAAAFFASFVFALTTIGTNISANSLGAGNDMTVLLPKVSFLSYHRRQSLIWNSTLISDGDRYCVRLLVAGLYVHGRFSPSTF